MRNRITGVAIIVLFVGVILISAYHSTSPNSPSGKDAVGVSQPTGAPLALDQCSWSEIEGKIYYTTEECQRLADGTSIEPSSVSVDTTIGAFQVANSAASILILTIIIVIVVGFLAACFTILAVRSI